MNFLICHRKEGALREWEPVLGCFKMQYSLAGAAQWLSVDI